MNLITTMHPDASTVFKARYGNFIGGRWVAPVDHVGHADPGRRQVGR